MYRCGQPTRHRGTCRNPVPEPGGRCHLHPAGPDPALWERLLGYLRAGNYLEVAARAVGLPLHVAVATAAQREQIATAQAEGESRSILRIASAAQENWQAAAWLIERQYPERWGRTAPRPDERPEPVAATRDTLDELAGKREARRAAAR